MDGGAFIARIQQQLGELASGGRIRLNKALSEEALHLVREGFRTQRNPYGEAWAPLKSRHGQALLKTGRLRSSMSVGDVSETGFRLGTNVKYAPVHQDGVDVTYHRASSVRNQAVGENGRFLSRKAAGKKRQGTLYNATRFTRLAFKGGSVHLVIPQRAFFPIRGRGLGVIWDTAFERAARNTIQRMLGRSSAA